MNKKNNTIYNKGLPSGAKRGNPSKYFKKKLHFAKNFVKNLPILQKYLKKDCLLPHTVFRSFCKNLFDIHPMLQIILVRNKQKKFFLRENLEKYLGFCCLQLLNCTSSPPSKEALNLKKNVLNFTTNLRF